MARLMGDAILAFFGAPTAHEDDPQRAVMAGLDILARIGAYREGLKAAYGLNFNVRVGINTGMVVVVEHGNRPSRELIDRTSAVAARWVDYWATTTGHRSSMTTKAR